MLKRKQCKTSYICFLALGTAIASNIFSVLLAILSISALMILTFPFGLGLGLLILPFIYAFPFNLTVIIFALNNFMNGKWGLSFPTKRHAVIYGMGIGLSSYGTGLILMFLDSLVLENQGIDIQMLKSWNDLLSWVFLVPVPISLISGIITFSLVKVMAKAALYEPTISRHSL